MSDNDDVYIGTLENQIEGLDKRVDGLLAERDRQDAEIDLLERALAAMTARKDGWRGVALELWGQRNRAVNSLENYGGPKCLVDWIADESMLRREGGPTIADVKNLRRLLSDGLTAALPISASDEQP